MNILFWQFIWVYIIIFLVILIGALTRDAYGRIKYPYYELDDIVDDAIYDIKEYFFPALCWLPIILLFIIIFSAVGLAAIFSEISKLIKGKSNV